MLLLFWFGGEFGTMLLACIALIFLYGQRWEDYMLYAYLAAFAGAALGAWLAFRIVANLSEVTIDEPPVEPA
jgi:hypothetical protein